MANKEATASNKINKLLEGDGWRFFAEGKSHANIQFEHSITLMALAVIEAEHALVAAKCELISRFKKEIQPTLDRPWCEAEPD
ncbi:MAG: hypothetical protein WC236_05670 [Gallionellaceae bacterium]|jgi:hypothetical protein